ncbi:His-Xaa-Ser system protein HxsD [Sphingobacterium sp. UBA6320]|uniref:His-Xaa-Ser system protein HxsD n=1 Tax=Sphingobacterium sp. UBA6320 TaxID=1947510 RepID=UPI0025CFEAC2|nr:His-Xaa-Ser system protein HxsD [Sphingobacterium sp. UBA6320]
MKVEFNDNNKIVLKIQSTFYSISVLHKCFYWYLGKFDVDIEKRNEDFIIKMSNIPDDLDKNNLISSIKKDLIDFNTREIIALETKDIRTLLIAKAFANDDEYNESPPGSLDDPIGFNPFDFKK